MISILVNLFCANFHLKLPLVYFSIVQLDDTVELFGQYSDEGSSSPNQSHASSADQSRLPSFDKLTASVPRLTTQPSGHVYLDSETEESERALRPGKRGTHTLHHSF